MIDTKTNIELTASGKKRLASLTDDINEQIFRAIRKYKYVPGDEVVEITASDIDKISSRIKILEPQQSQTRQLILVTYSFLGLVLLGVGFFYDEFYKILTENSTRLILISTGFIISLVSAVLSIYLKQRHNQEKEIEIAENEKNKYSEIYTLINESTARNNSASVQYNDLKGTAALDFHGSLNELWDIFRKYKIDTERYEPFGLSLYYGQTGYFGLSLLGIDKVLAENKHYNGLTIPVISISTKVTKEEFESYYKRFHILLTRKDNENFEIFNEITI